MYLSGVELRKQQIASTKAHRQVSGVLEAHVSRTE
jgi:hypothetical protein